MEQIETEKILARINNIIQIDVREIWNINTLYFVKKRLWQDLSLTS